VVDDAGLVRLAQLWVVLATAAAGEAGADATTAVVLLDRLRVEGKPGALWLQATTQLLVQLVEESGRVPERIAEPFAVLQESAGGAPATSTAISAALAVARFLRLRRRIGPGAWLSGPPGAAAAAVLAAYDDGLALDVVVDLLAELVEDDVVGVDLLDALVCATAQVLVQVEPTGDEALRRLQVNELLTGLPEGPRGPRWLMAACLREAPEHDPGALDLTPYLPRDAGTDPDRAADKVGLLGMLRLGLTCIEALAASFGDEAELSRSDVLGVVLPTALAEHELLRQEY
jgi:hypothetical protein